MPDHAEAYELFQDGFSVPTDCAHCGELVWSGQAEWVGVKPYHPECEDKLFEETLDEMMEEISNE